ncbi:DUF948 domain-containing protein [Cohnella soli]|uniref:DUF948 domain-containing protein n=1 Tax=Cohnella soli TaxID=425005 RepID=A0ABW0HWS4_9BACL
MELTIQISAAVIAIAVIVLLCFLVWTFRTLTETLKETKQTIVQIRTEVTQMSMDVKEAVHNTNLITRDVRLKLSSLDGLFNSFNDIGNVLQSFTGAAKECAASSAKESGILVSIYDGILSAIRIWNKVKKI